MTTLATADVHFSDNPRDEYRFKFLEEWLPQAVEEHDVRRVLILGDICEAKDAHRAPLVNRIVDGLANIAETTNVILLKGNHDYLSEDAPFFGFTRHLPRVRWISEPTDLKLRGLGRCLFLPHTNNYKRDWGDFAFNEYDWIFCHQTFDGAVNENGRSLEGVPRSVFPSGARVVSGDIHVPQKLGPVTYTGSPYTVDFGDDYEGRLLLLDHDKVNSIPFEGPQKRLIVVGGKDTLKALDQESNVINKGDTIEVRITLNSSQAAERTQIRRAVREWGEHKGFNVHTVRPIIDKRVRSTRVSKPPKQRDDGELIRAYVKKHGLDKTTLNVGMKLMEEA